MKSILSLIVLSNCKRIHHSHDLVSLGDWSDLGDNAVMGINGVQNYINSKETFGYRLPKPTIHTSLFSEAGSVANALELKNTEREKAVAGLK